MRDYDPTTGRYLQADPLGLIDGASVYGYALQNPRRHTDQRGEFIAQIIGGAIGALISTVKQVAVYRVCGETGWRDAFLCVDVKTVAVAAFFGAAGVTPVKEVTTGQGPKGIAVAFGTLQIPNLDAPSATVGELAGLNCNCDVGGFPEWLKT
jgi:hypothetical protein